MLATAESFINSLDDNFFVRPIKNSDVCTEPELRKACEQNVCGHYGQNWMCPPHIGEINSLIDKIRECGDGLLLQSVFLLDDPFDYEGMMNFINIHTEKFMELKNILEKKYNCNQLFSLNAGSCSVCGECTAKTDEKCRFPRKAIASVESHGVDVAKTLTNAGLKYNNGPNSVYYAGIILKR